MAYVLEPGEGILQQNNTSVTGGLQIDYAKAMLTSRYIVFLEESEDEEEEYDEVAKLPLSNLRIFQNKPQIFIAGDSLEPEMQVYFNDMTLTMHFDIFRPSKCKEAYQKWIDSISSVVSSWPCQTNAQPTSLNSPAMTSVSQMPSGIVPTQRNFCGNCGQRIDMDARFCKYCGNRL